MNPDRSFTASNRPPFVEDSEQDAARILGTIREAERAVADRIQAAQARADRRLAEARRQADALGAERKRQTSMALADLAEAARREGHQRAEDIVRRAEEDAKAIRDRAAARLEEAVDLILRRVLPVPDDTEGSTPPA